ncbi:MAG: spermidine/putrescine transport system permease protein [Chloroflexota bacterium]|jgi:spermidine/putrescine transport system permease protein|nr:spermidine/putrescine transport system permease protein [Chloroflexota bacterium]
MASATAVAGRRRGSGSERLGRFLDRWLLPLYVVGVTTYLILPVAVMILFSFNDPTGRSNLNWREFSLGAWLNPLGRPGLSDAVRNSIVVALLSTVIATAFGTMIALALARYNFRGRAATNVLIFLPMSTPEIVLGASLLTTFVASVQLPIPEGLVFPLSIRTILIAHIMFNISYVVVTVKARLANFPRHLEEAAMDLGANEWTTFWKVTFPLILPGVIAAALLAFSLSIDDFVITAFTSGQTQTFPLYIYGSQLRGIPVQVNVIGTIIFVSAVALVVLSTLWQRRVAARDYAGSVA